jgi:hypothetical protein
MSNLPNTGISLDSPRISEMNDFLNMILAISKQNNTILSTDDVYYLLCRTNIKENDHEKKQYIENLFYTWIDRFKEIRNINVFRADNWRYFCQFTNKMDLVGLGGRDIKIYVPLDYEHLAKGVNELFDFMTSLDMAHASKVGMDLRNDNVVIRLPLEDTKNAYRIIDFCNSNKYIKAGLNKTNPFVPDYNGIGLMYEEGFSYNHEIAEGIAKFINKNLHKNSVNVGDFNREFDSLFKNNEYYNSIKSAYSEAIGFTKGQFEKPSNDFKVGFQLTPEQKEEIFIKTATATYDKYGIEQVNCAIFKAINSGDYNFFTSGGKDLRKQLKDNVSSKEMFNMIYNIVSKKFGDASKIDLVTMVERFTSISFGNTLSTSLDAICNATLQKYGPEQLKVALSDFYYFGGTMRFTRHSSNPNDSTNYREMLSNFDKFSIISTIKTNLQIAGVNIERMNEEELIEYYANYLSNINSLSNDKNGPRK